MEKNKPQILVVDSVYKTYGGKKALQDVSLDLAGTQILCILGPTGCGKTTILKIITGLEAPDKGRIYVRGELSTNGKDILTSPSKRGIGLVFQDDALWPHMTVRENIEYGLGRFKDDGHLRKIANILELDGLMDRLPATLSGGQRKCVGIARALSGKPGILLLDEPMSGLDWVIKERLNSLIRQVVVEFGVGAVYVTHDQLEAGRVADEIIVLNNGAVEQRGSMDVLKNEPATGFIREFIQKINR